MTPEEALKEITKRPHWIGCMCEKCKMEDVLREQRKKLARRRPVRRSDRGRHG